MTAAFLWTLLACGLAVVVAAGMWRQPVKVDRGQLDRSDAYWRMIHKHERGGR